MHDRSCEATMRMASLRRGRQPGRWLPPILALDMRDAPSANSPSPAPSVPVHSTQRAQIAPWSLDQKCAVLMLIGDAPHWRSPTNGQQRFCSLRPFTPIDFALQAPEKHRIPVAAALTAAWRLAPLVLLLFFAPPLCSQQHSSPEPQNVTSRSTCLYAMSRRPSAGTWRRKSKRVALQHPHTFPLLFQPSCPCRILSVFQVCA